ncbi:MAG: hypothetical protein ABEH88_02955 [Halobacteriales archaeon]
MSKPVDEEASGEDTDEHLHGLKDGAGCTEIWTHLSERRAEGE